MFMLRKPQNLISDLRESLIAKPKISILCRENQMKYGMKNK